MAEQSTHNGSIQVRFLLALRPNEGKILSIKLLYLCAGIGIQIKVKF